MRYALRRLGFYLLAACVAVVLNFVIPRLMPGDPASTMFARFQGRLAPEAMESLRAAFGFTGGSLPAQFGSYLSHLVRGDLGISIAYFPAPVTEVFGTGLLWTMLLAGGSLVVAFCLGTALGALAAWRRNGWLDSVLPPLLALLGAFPFFWLAMLVLDVFGFRLGWFPLRHAHSPDIAPGFTWAFVSNVAYHAALPAMTVVPEPYLAKPALPPISPVMVRLPALKIVVPMEPPVETVPPIVRVRPAVPVLMLPSVETTAPFHVWLPALLSKVPPAVAVLS